MLHTHTVPTLSNADRIAANKSVYKRARANAARGALVPWMSFVRLDCMGVQLWLRQSYVLVTPVEVFTPVPLGPNEAVVGGHAVELTL